MSISPLGVRSDERVAVFIDGPNLYSAAKNAQIDIDYKKLLAHLEDQCLLLRAYYYTTLKESDEPDGYTPIRPLIDWLGYNGYHMVTKPMKEFHDSETGQRRLKGNMNVEITVDVLGVLPHLDHVILFSGDSDYRRLIEAVQEKGVRITVISSMRNGTPMVADEIRRQADRFIDLYDLKDTIGRDLSERRAAAR